MTVLLARVTAGQPREQGVSWVGSSMGGLIGLMLAHHARSPLRRLVLNDVGPFIPAAALKRIASYVGEQPSFASLEEAERHMRARYTAWGPSVSDADWRRIAAVSTRRGAGGELRLAYDPGIAVPFAPAASAGDVDLWPLWERVQCPVLLLRGADSDVLPREVAARMGARAGVELREYASTGHMPPLLGGQDTRDVLQWLLRQLPQ
jgi:pimeloyl-ACP methyl ester carboxylesterase